MHAQLVQGATVGTFCRFLFVWFSPTAGIHLGFAWNSVRTLGKLAPVPWGRWGKVKGVQSVVGIKKTEMRPHCAVS